MDPSSIEIRPLATHGELAACVELQQSTWGDAFTDVVPVSILKVSQRIGGIAVGAFDADGALLGFVFGLTGVERGRIVHWSDMLAVKPEARNIGLGRRLKEHQRLVVRELGAAVIYWTYDPLIARNAHLNFNRLGARLAEYVEDMYGITDSVLHGGLPTDRLIVAWPTHDDEIQQRLAEAERTLGSVDCQQSPIATEEWIAGAAGAAILPHCVRIEIPADAERLLIDTPNDVVRWRYDVRAALQWGVSAGYTVTAFSLEPEAPTGYYLMTKIARPASLAVRS
jgi:chorismate synthase